MHIQTSPHPSRGTHHEAALGWLSVFTVSALAWSGLIWAVAR